MRIVLVGLVFVFFASGEVKGNEEQTELEVSQDAVELFTNLAIESIDSSVLFNCPSWPHCDSPDVNSDYSVSYKRECSDSDQSENN